ncbi:rab-GTPase-TBC domain-containing protein [Cokeromyces recurvatus]|uniref:rab-GTPase-TBC domain-containing protein n=1 Tax=Cokeromyces recurvatus TaxID=90255 RepID=UPI002220EA8F|nr:rab-GTPase-TBC domain-containing protein [Cokeromyces recurvatus]KAI7899282.1 rab-GTPase-TBC domain-containing protein [Cokeromyces recurvatus]
METNNTLNVSKQQNIKSTMKSDLESNVILLDFKDVDQFDFQKVIPDDDVCNYSSSDEFEDASSTKVDSIENSDLQQYGSLQGIKIYNNEDCQTPSLPKQVSSSNSSSSNSRSSDSFIKSTQTRQDSIVENNNSALLVSYYDKLLAKFTSRKGNHNFTKQIQLKEETSHNLELLKEEQQEDVDWGITVYIYLFIYLHLYENFLHINCFLFICIYKAFWTSVIFNFNHVNKTEHTKLRLQLSNGMPPQLRGKLWRIFSDSETDNDLIENEYRELLDKTSPYEKLMKRDVSRAFPNLPFFKEKDGQQMLFNVIKAYSLFDQNVGYCQGIHFVVGCLLLHMPDEAAFSVLIKLMTQYGLRGHFTPQMETLHERMYQFNQLLKMHVPQVFHHLDAQGVLPSMYASQWFMTLFAYRCPLDLVYRVFDLLFVEGSQVILHFTLALMKKNQQTILSLEFENLLEFFSNHVFDVYKDDAFQFVQDAYTFDISLRLLSKLSKQYQVKAKKEAKIQSIEDDIKRENIKLQKQLTELQHSYKTLELEHQEVAQQLIQAKINRVNLDVENQQLKHELSVMKVKVEKIKTSVNGKQQQKFEELVKQNAYLIETNTILEDKLSELEVDLI